MESTIANEIYEDDRRSPDTPIYEDARPVLRRLCPEAAFRGPLFEGRDRIAQLLATVMLIGPLITLPLGFGG